MSDNGNGFDGGSGFSGPLVVPFGNQNLASEMIGADEKIKQLFLTLTYFMDEEEAMDYADIIHKCEKYGMKNERDRWLKRIAAKVSIKGYRSAQIVDVLTQIQRMAESERRAKERDVIANRGVKTPNA